METEKYTSKDIELRSEETNDILNSPPPKLLRVSNIIIFFITIIIFLLSFVVSIPIYSKIPIDLEPLYYSSTKQNGKVLLKNLIIKPLSTQKIKKNQIIATLDSTVDPTEFLKLKKNIEKNIYEKVNFIGDDYNVSLLGVIKKDYLNYISGEISTEMFYKILIEWENRNLIVSNKNGILSIELDEKGFAEYSISPKNNVKYMTTELSQEDISQLKEKKYVLTIISPLKYKDKKINVSIINEKYLKKQNEFKLILEMENFKMQEDDVKISGYINIMIENKKIIYYLFPFFEKKV